jgi:hypothetical protein
MPNSRARRHHQVSNFYLKGFGNERGQIVQTHLADQTQNIISTDNATVAKDFYTVALEDGEMSDAVEKYFGTIEGPAALALAAVLREKWPLDATERRDLARWIGLQMLRGNGTRESQNQATAQMIRVLVGISGKPALRSLIETAEGTPLSDEDLDAEWNDVTKDAGPDMVPDVLFHSRMIYRLLPVHQKLLTAGHWSLVRFSRKTLVTCDHPVAFYSRPNPQSWESLALANAVGITVALSRNVGLQVNFNDFSGLSDALIPPTSNLALSFNQQTINNARRFIYHHPSDQIPTEVPLPAMRKVEIMPVDNNFINEDGIFANVDDEARRALSTSHIPEGARGASMSLTDLGWPIENRLPFTRPSQR